MQITGTVLGFSWEISSDFDITLLCFVGVDGCAEHSTGISSSGDHSTSVSASAGATLATYSPSPPEETISASRHRGNIFSFPEIRQNNLSAQLHALTHIIHDGIKHQNKLQQKKSHFSFACSR